MGAIVKMLPTMSETFEYKRNIGIDDKYRELADKFIGVTVISRYSAVDNELLLGDEILWDADSSCNIVITNGEYNKTMSLAEVAEEYKSSGGMVLKSIHDAAMFELYQALCITDTKDVGKYAHENYGDILEVIKCEDGMAVSEEICVIEAFLNAGVALPVYLVESYREIKEEVETRNLIESVKSDIGDAYEYFWNSNSFICNICKDKGTPEDIMNVGYALAEMTKFLAEHGLKNIMAVENLLNATTQEIYCVRIGDIERLATKKEIKSLISGVYKKRVFNIDEYKISMIQIVWWLISGDKKYARFAGIKKEESIIDEIRNNIGRIMKAVAWMSSEKFMEEDVPSLIEGSKVIEYPDTVSEELELSTDLTTTKMLKFVKDNVDRADSYGAMTYDIVCKALKDKQHRLSEKQYSVVKKQYDLLTKPKEEPKLSEEAVKIINEIKTNYYKSASRIAKSIIDYAVEHNFVSDKQLKVLKDEIERQREHQNGSAESGRENKYKRREKSVGGVTQSDLEVAKAAEIFGISFDAAAISNSLGRGEEHE